MRILGIDPGTSLIGYGIIEGQKGKYISLTHGALRTPSNIQNSQRLETVDTFLRKLIADFKPEKIAIEKLFFFKNAKTVMAVSEMRGALMMIATTANLPIHEYTPLQVKQAVSGYGRAEKKQVQKMVQLILELKDTPKPDDVADALALAICCANTIVYESK